MCGVEQTWLQILANRKTCEAAAGDLPRSRSCFHVGGRPRDNVSAAAQCGPIQLDPGSSSAEFRDWCGQAGLARGVGRATGVPPARGRAALHSVPPGCSQSAVPPSATARVTYHENVTNHVRPRQRSMATAHACLEGSHILVLNAIWNAVKQTCMVHPCPGGKRRDGAGRIVILCLDVLLRCTRAERRAPDPSSQVYCQVRVW